MTGGISGYTNLTVVGAGIGVTDIAAIRAVITIVIVSVAVIGAIVIIGWITIGIAGVV